MVPNRELDLNDSGWEALAGLGHGESGPAVVRFVGRERTRRYFEIAFDLAVRAGRRKVTVAHRANFFKKTDGLWLECAEDVSRRFPDLEFDDQLVDHLALQLARSPHRYDVVLVNEIYGDVIGDLAVGLAGGLGVVPQVHYGSGGVIFTSVHGTAPKYAGMDRANPCAMILSAAEMLNELKEPQAASRVEKAVHAVLRSGLRTVDLCVDGTSSPAIGTQEFTDAVVERIRGGASQRRSPRKTIAI